MARSLKQHESRLQALLGELSHAQRVVQEESSRLSEARQRLAEADAAQKIIQSVARVTQELAHQQIISIVSRCLEAVFGENSYEFQINFEQKRGKTEAVLCLSEGGVLLEDPTDQTAGGAIDVCAFALRLAALLLSVPRKRRLLILDEPFRMLSEEYVPRVAELLETLSQELNLQIIMVTHNPQLHVGKVIKL